VAVTTDSREIECGRKRYRLRRYPDGVLGIFDQGGKLVLGWPETTVFGDRQLDDGEDADWCSTFSRVRKVS
jgi:hypothetical protein